MSQNNQSTTPFNSPTGSLFPLVNGMHPFIPVNGLPINGLPSNILPVNSLPTNGQCLETFTTTVGRDSYQFQTSRLFVNGPPIQNQEPKIQVIETSKVPKTLEDREGYLILGKIGANDLQKIKDLIPIVSKEDLYSLNRSELPLFDGIFLSHPDYFDLLGMYRKENLSFLREFLKIGGCMLIPDCHLDEKNFRFNDSNMHFEDCLSCELAKHEKKSRDYHRHIITKCDIGITLTHAFKSDENMLFAFLNLFFDKIREKNLKVLTECGFNATWVSVKEVEEQFDKQYPQIFLGELQIYGFYRCTRI